MNSNATTLSPTFEALTQHIEALNDSGALELHYTIDTNGKKRCYLPYIMNDSLEYYLILEDCRITGAFSEAQDFVAPAADDLSAAQALNMALFSDLAWAECIEDEDQMALIIHKTDESIFTVWFPSFSIIQNCYQYHQIGHFWVPGQEQWRRATYILGTIYDKYQYVGDMICNSMEKTLYPLMEFAPLRMWFPIRSEHPFASDYYDDTDRGFQTMKQLAQEAEDRDYLRLMGLYQRFAGLPWMRHFLNPWLGRALTSPKRQVLYDLLLSKIQAASQSYPIRDYGPEQNQLIQEQRTQVTNHLTAAGFTGAYPLFHRGSTQIFAAEEHPFTILEDEKFQFRVQFMISEPVRQSSNAVSCEGLCYGFFQSGSSSGSIVSNISDLPFIGTANIP